MIVNVFFLAAAGDSIIYSLKNWLRPMGVALRPSGLLLAGGLQLKALFDWIGQRAQARTR
jgi:hypothetical protein